MGIDSPSRRPDAYADRAPEYRHPIDAPYGVVDNPRDGYYRREPVTLYEVEEVNRWVLENTDESISKIHEKFAKGFKPDQELNLDKWVTGRQTKAALEAIKLTFKIGYNLQNDPKLASKWADQNTELANYALALAIKNGWVPSIDDVSKLVMHKSTNADLCVYEAVRRGHPLSQTEVEELSTHGTKNANDALQLAVERGKITLTETQIQNIIDNTPNSAIEIPPVVEAARATLSQTICD